MARARLLDSFVFWVSRKHGADGFKWLTFVPLLQRRKRSHRFRRADPLASPFSSTRRRKRSVFRSTPWPLFLLLLLNKLLRRPETVQLITNNYLWWAVRVAAEQATVLGITGKRTNRYSRLGIASFLEFTITASKWNKIVFTRRHRRQLSTHQVPEWMQFNL